LPSIAEIVLITINPVNIQPFSEEIWRKLIIGEEH